MRRSIDPGNRDVVERNPLRVVSSLDLSFEHSRRVKPIRPGRSAGALNLRADRTHPGTNRRKWLERTHIERREEMTVLPRFWPGYHVAELGAVACTGQERAEHAHDDSQTDALVLPRRLDQT